MITFGSRNKLRAIAIRFELESFDNYTCFCPPLIPTPRSPTVLSITLLLHLYVSSPLGMNRVKSSMCIWFTTSFTLSSDTCYNQFILNHHTSDPYTIFDRMVPLNKTGSWGTYSMNHSFNPHNTDYTPNEISSKVIEIYSI